MRRNYRTETMLKMAGELAGHGHRLQMIEAMLEANGFYDAYEFLGRPHVQNELLDIADRARRGEAEEASEETTARR